MASMSSFSAILPILAIATVAALPSESGARSQLDHLKCSGAAAGSEPRLVLDGRFEERSPGEAEIRSLDLHSVYVLCWDPERRVLQKDVGEPVVYVETNGFLDSIHADLDRILAAQHAFHEKTQRFADDLDDLGIADLTPGTMVELTATTDGWHATARGELFIRTCHIYEGASTLSRPDLVEGTPACFLQLRSAE